MRLGRAKVKNFVVRGDGRKDVFGLLKKILRQSIEFIKESNNIGRVRFEVKLSIREKE